MSNHEVPSLHEYLAAKTETQLRNYLFKMESGAARLCHHNIFLCVLISKECGQILWSQIDDPGVQGVQGILRGDWSLSMVINTT